MSSRSLAKTEIARLRDELARATLDTMWAQWRAIGGSASGATTAAAIVDPEALILASLHGQDDEPRLRDVLYAWIERNASLVSVRRLRTLARVDDTPVAERMRRFAATATKLAKHPRWQALTNTADDAEASIEKFAVGRAVAPSLTWPPALMLRMRVALGVGTKADALTYLLGQADRPRPDPTTVRAIAQALGYTLVATRGALDDLTTGQFVLASPSRPVSFAIPQRGWRDLLSLAHFPAWWPWHQIYAFAWQFLEWAGGARTRNASDAVLRIHEREVLALHPAVQQIISVHQTSFAGTAPRPVSALVSWLASAM